MTFFEITRIENCAQLHTVDFRAPSCSPFSLTQSPGVRSYKDAHFTPNLVRPDNKQVSYMLFFSAISLNCFLQGKFVLIYSRNVPHFPFNVLFHGCFSLSKNQSLIFSVHFCVVCCVHSSYQQSTSRLFRPLTVLASAVSGTIFSSLFFSSYRSFPRYGFLGVLALFRLPSWPFLIV